MVYRKYIKRGGKIFGPYYYESYRDSSGKVRKRYAGIVEDKTVTPTRFLILGVMILSVFVLFMFSSNKLTGNASLDIRESYISGENISGNLTLGLKEGELIPADTMISLTLAGEQKNFLLSDLVEPNNNGSYYTEQNQGSATSITGYGEGYGFIGEKLVYPDVYFTLLVSSSEIVEVNLTENNSGETPANETLENITETRPAANETPENVIETNPAANETISEQPILPETPLSTEQNPPQIPEEQTSPEPPAETSPPESSSPMTGNIIADIPNDQEVSGSASKNHSFEVSGDAQIKQGSVYSNSSNLSESVLNLEKSGGKTIITTDYEVKENGFGKDYLGNLKELQIDLGKIGIAAKSGELVVRLVWDNITLAEASRSIDVSEENITEINQTETNLTNATITTRQYKAVIGKPVRWIKTISLENNTNAQIEIPKEAENISIRTGSEVDFALQQSQENVNARSLMTGNAILDNQKNPGILTRLFELLTKGITGRVIDSAGNISGGAVTETGDSKMVDISGSINESSGKIAVEYQTPAPTAEESEIPGGKEVVVSAPSELGYTDILAYSELNNSVKMSEKSKINLYWNNNESGTVKKEEVPFDAYDLDEDGNIDYIEWNVPHLSSQVYEILIEISKAELLDSNRVFVSDIYDKVKAQDGDWQNISDGQYIRVTFNQTLTSKNDITLYARGEGKIEVYSENDNNTIMEFNISGENTYKNLLTSLGSSSFSTFDLRFSGNIDVDYIVDPLIGSQAGVFDGSSYVSLGTSSGLEGLQVPMTISGWYSQMDVSGDQAITGAYQSASGAFIYSLIRLRDGTMEFYTSDAGGHGGYQELSSTHTTSASNWHFFAITVNGSIASPTVKIYIDNYSPDTFTPYAFYNPVSTSVPIHLGKDEFGDYFNGRLDEIRTWNRTLSASEITNLYNSGAGTCGSSEEGLVAGYHLDDDFSDYSGNGNDGTNNGVTFTSSSVANCSAESLQGPQAGVFDGSSYISTSANPAGNFTATAWFKTSSCATGVGCRIVTVNSVNSGGGGIALTIADDDQSLSTLYDVVQWGTKTTSVTDGNWHFGVLTYDSATGESNVYLDGGSTPVSSLTNTPSIGSITYIGASYYDVYGGVFAYFNGSIDEVQIYNKILSQEEITALYNSGAGGCGGEAGANLVASYNFDGNVNDDSGKGHNGIWAGAEQYVSSPLVVGCGSAGGSCSPPGSGTWDIDCASNCVFNSGQVNVPGDVNITGSGEINFMSGSSWKFTSTNQYVYIYPGCRLNLNSGSGFNS
jgi:hypothetical protein